MAKACNKMMNSIRDYIRQTKENYERESRLIENELIMKNDLKEAQLKYLQAQINPHFLFNSLNAAAQLAMMEGAENTCLFVQNMADFFRYNVRKMEKDTTLKEELELVDNYIYILNVRFAGEIHYTKQIDERVTGTMMPSMILQPLIENAIIHGIFETPAKTGRLLVRTADGVESRLVHPERALACIPNLCIHFNREANTIGSKCSDIDIARQVVDIKAEIEKIREQVQNIE